MPNGDLISAVVQSSATILAVVAGLITSSVLSISARRETAEETVDQVKQRLEMLKRQQKKFEFEIETTAIDHYLFGEIEKVLEYGIPLPAADQVQAELGYQGYSSEAFSERWSRLSRRAKDVADWIQSHIGDGDFRKYYDVDDWMEGRSIPDPQTDGFMFHYVYQFLRGEYLKTLPSQPMRPNSFGSPFLDASLLVSPEVRNIQRENERERDRAHQTEVHAIQEAVRDIGIEIDRTTTELDIAQTQLQQLSGSPQHLTFGYWVMVGLAVGGVAIPLALMMDDWSEWKGSISFGIFLICLTVLAWYMAVLIFPERMKPWYPR
jgi:hypothetical protein